MIFPIVPILITIGGGLLTGCSSESRRGAVSSDDGGSSGNVNGSGGRGIGGGIGIGGNIGTGGSGGTGIGGYQETGGYTSGGASGMAGASGGLGGTGTGGYMSGGAAGMSGMAGAAGGQELGQGGTGIGGGIGTGGTGAGGYEETGGYTSGGEGGLSGGAAGNGGVSGEAGEQGLGQGGTGIGGGIGTGGTGGHEETGGYTSGGEGGTGGTGIGGGIDTGGTGSGGYEETGGYTSGGEGGTGGTGIGGGIGTGGTGGEICTAYPPILETDLLPGQPDGESQIDHLRRNGSIGLLEQWTDCYLPENGFPEDGTWERFPTEDIGATIQLTTFPAEPYPALRLNTFGHENYETDPIGIDQFLYYTKPSSLDHATGWVFSWNLMVAYTDEASYSGRAVSLFIPDDFYMLEFDILSAGVNEFYSGSTVGGLDTGLRHDYRVAAHGGNTYTFSIDGTAVSGSPWTFWNDAPLAFYEWGDHAPGDSVTFWGRVCYYENGDKVPFFSTGDDTTGYYNSRVFDLSSSNNNLGQGAYITFNGEEPAGTNITFQTRSGDPDIPDGSWSTWADALYDNDGDLGYMIQSPEARHLQVKVILNTSDPTISPRLDDLAVNYEVCTNQ